MAFSSFRAWLEHLRNTGRLVDVEVEVNLRYEVAAIAKRLDGRKAVLFHRPSGVNVPVASGVVSHRRWIAEALGCTLHDLVHRFRAACDQPMPVVRVREANAPVYHQVQTENIDLLKTLPIPIHHEHDAGPYITAGLVIVRDPCTRKQNVAIHRLQVTGPNRMGVLLLPRHTLHLFRQAESAGRPLECAVAIGVDPATLLASQASTPFGVDELEIASALRGEPLPVVRCRTVDVDVPADAEIVIEGHILPHVREPEGPFGEFPRYYGPRSDKHVIEVTAVLMRRNPIYHTIVPAGYEHLLLGGIPREASLFESVRQLVPTVRAVYMTPGGSCRYHAVISIRKTEEGQGKNAILGALANSFDIKHVVVVDEDVDIYNPEEVEWAIATRFQADRDLVIVSNSQGSKLDPSTDDGVGSKVGLDCTVPLNADSFRFQRIEIPGFAEMDWSRYGLEHSFEEKE
ncbi:UbiD family decarboxylase [Alicyclobacillus sendaiensis]|uniref:UbiD family decarboxylase n=1 Tax=Alicyclobacillus sendaiensis PA2 TaxID=3029425 RepID=A0ABT6XUR1_ALISE|nr:UbiD family decarboxylase [Alicyclobacillus sendaiensis]MDI9258720.1 UbiD family decarboxylase [Alicyclobacillus sendaiensis PA2]